MKRLLAIVAALLALAPQLGASQAIVARPPAVHAARRAVQGTAHDESRLRPGAYTSGIATESLGQPALGATTHAVAYEDYADNSFQVWYWCGRAPAGSGEIGTGGICSGRASVIWINASGAQQVTRLVGPSGEATVTVADKGLLKFYGPAVHPKVGSHYWLNLDETCSASCVYSHGKADYGNGEGLQYGASVPDYTGTATKYGNTYSGAADYYGPVFIGGDGSRTTGVIDGDSREAGVLTSVVADLSDNLYGARSEFGRLLLPYMALIDISVPGGTSQEMSIAANTPVRDQLAKMAQRRFMGLGVNDTIFQGATSAQVASWEATRATRLGLPVTYKTISPVVTDATHNTVYSATNDPARQAENARRRGSSDTFDAAGSTESGSTGTFVNLAYTTDGTHLSAAGDGAANAGYSVTSKIPGAAAFNAGYRYAAGAAYQNLGLTGFAGQQAAITSTAFYSPEHKLTATVIREDATASSGHDVYLSSSLALASTTKTFTFFAKRVAGARNVEFRVQMAGGSYSDTRTLVNLGTGAVIYSTSGNSAATLGTVSVTAFDDYYKVAMPVTFTSAMTSGQYLYFYLVSDASGTDTYTGDNTSSIAVWGLDVR